LSLVTPKAYSNLVKKGILETGKNCWRICNIEQLSLLLDSQNYYQAFLECSQKAGQSLHIAGWEIDARMLVDPLNKNPNLSFRHYLNQISDKVVDIHLLSWKAPFYLRFGRERFAGLKWKLNSSSKVKFTHNRYPYCFGSYHEKVAIIDQKCAFLGGIDLAKMRWDTTCHDGNDDRRRDWNGKRYNPIHDLQFVLTGSIINDIAEFIQKRSDKNLFFTQQSPSLTAPVWPDSFSPEIHKIKGAISRTDAEEGIFEIEDLYVDAIRSAELFILIENQYFSHHGIIKELALQLKRDNGPEIVIILPVNYRGKFERSIYLTQRNRAIKVLKEADRYGRLKFYYPENASPKNFIVVHSKYMVVDNSFMTLGSANLNYRSMRVDREINLGLDGQNKEKIQRFIADSVSRIMADHLGINEKEFAYVFMKNKSLIQTIETLRNRNTKTLNEIHYTHIPLPIWLLNFLYPIVDIKLAVPKKNLYLFLIGLLFLILIAAKVINGTY